MLRQTKTLYNSNIKCEPLHRKVNLFKLTTVFYGKVTFVIHNAMQVTQKEFPCPKCHALTSVVKPELPLDKWSETLPSNTMMDALLESASLQVK